MSVTCSDFHPSYPFPPSTVSLPNTGLLLLPFFSWLSKPSPTRHPSSPQTHSLPNSNSVLSPATQTPPCVPSTWGLFLSPLLFSLPLNCPTRHTLTSCPLCHLHHSLTLLLIIIFSFSFGHNPFSPLPTLSKTHLTPTYFFHPF